MNDALLTCREAAELLGYANKCPNASVANLIRRGRLPGVLLGDGQRHGGEGCWRVWRSDVLALQLQLRRHSLRLIEREAARVARLDSERRRAS
jgi:hypothetical protein